MVNAEITLRYFFFLELYAFLDTKGAVIWFGVHVENIYITIRTIRNIVSHSSKGGPDSRCLPPRVYGNVHLTLVY